MKLIYLHGAIMDGPGMEFLFNAKAECNKRGWAYEAPSSGDPMGWKDSHLPGLQAKIEHNTVLVGYSSGGFMAEELATKNPDKIIGVLNLSGSILHADRGPLPDVGYLKIHGDSDIVVNPAGGILLKNMDIFRPARYVAARECASIRSELAAQEGTNFSFQRPQGFWQRIFGRNLDATEYKHSAIHKTWIVKNSGHLWEFDAKALNLMYGEVAKWRI